MVSFATHTNHFSNENNPNSSSMEPLNDLQGSKREPRKTFEKSPHPNKKLVLLGNDEEDMEEQPHGRQESVHDASMMAMLNSNMYAIGDGVDLVLQPCVTNVDSPQASGKGEQTQEAQEQAQEQAAQDGSVMMEQQQLQQEQESSTGFDEWVASVETPDPHVQTYLSTKARRIQATEQFQLSMEKCLDGLHRAMTQEFLAESVGTIFNDNASLMDDIEETIQATLHSNHRQRNQMRNQLDQANSFWEHQFKRMRATLAPTSLTGSSSLEESSSTTSASTNDASTGASPAISRGMVEEDAKVSNVTSEEENGQEGATAISWEELAADEMTGPVARSFLDARKKRRDAEDVLSNALDEIHAGLQADVNDISQAIVTVFEQLQQATSSLEKDIERNTVRNARRRQDLELRLQESSKQTLGLLSGLMTRLAGSSSST